jgi:hypothetical protein
MYSVGKYLQCTGNKFNFLNIIAMKGMLKQWIPSSPSLFCKSKFIPCNFPIDEVKDKFCLIYEIKISILFLWYATN